MQTIDGIINEPNVNFVGKDGFFWWVGEVEDNEDPMELGRVKCRVLGYYTNVRGGTVGDLPTEHLPWATVLQHTSQAGNDGQGESSGQLQPGAIVMGFFMDGESAQMPIVIGVMRVKKSAETADKKQFAFTGENILRELVITIQFQFQTQNFPLLEELVLQIILAINQVLRVVVQIHLNLENHLNQFQQQMALVDHGKL
jgi:hypothetical protein